MSYRKTTDELLLILGDSDKMNMFRPKQMYVTIGNISKLDLEPALDNMDYGFAGHLKSISFDIPYEHSLGIQKWRRKWFETIYGEDDALHIHQLEKVTEQLKANHIVAHIPHFLTINKEQELPAHIPLIKYIANNNFMRVSTEYNQMWGREVYESKNNRPMSFD